jgi:hypothetical protein
MPAVGDRSHTQRRAASTNLQCTKSREAEHPAAAGGFFDWLPETRAEARLDRSGREDAGAPGRQRFV